MVVDPSHGTGHAYLVEPMAMAAAAAGADGIMIEVHNDPPHAPVWRGPVPHPGAVCPDRPEDLPDSGGDAGMTVGIIGLGLIGGSLAKAYRRDPSVTVLGWDRDPSITEFAQIAQAIQGPSPTSAWGSWTCSSWPPIPRRWWSAWSAWRPCSSPTPWSSTAPAPKEKVCQKVLG